ncbi:MAG: hypothetical protein ACKODH_03355 [Limisphaerales bacterium]
MITNLSLAHASHRPLRLGWLSILAAALQLGAAEPAGDPVAPWTKGVRLAPVSAVAGRHTIHSYYVANPESPDGKHVLFFSSQHPAGYVGEVRILERATGRETVLAENVHTEDAHRAACQQWLSGGQRVAFHEVVGKQWRVVVVDVATRAKTVVAEDRQLGFGQPAGDLLPLYGCHWSPGPHRDLELWDARTGKLTRSATIAEVEAKYGDWLKTEFAGKPCSIFFPVISPDLKRVFFKIAAGNGGDNFMSKSASHRQGLVCYDFAQGQCFWQRAKWGHPAWEPDSRHIFEMGNIRMDTNVPEIQFTKLNDVPNLRGSHPSVSPDGKLMVTDGYSEAAGGPPLEWGVMVADLNGGKWALLHSFVQSKGALSWRRNDPHPAFSADSRRIYYNVSDGQFTRLFVAERAQP